MGSMYNKITFEIVPDDRQKNYIDKRFRIHRLLYNYTMEKLKVGQYQRNTADEIIELVLTSYRAGVEKKRYPDIRNVSAEVYIDAIRHAINAFRNGFKNPLKTCYRYSGTLPLNLKQDRPGFFRIGQSTYLQIGYEHRELTFPKNITQFTIQKKDEVYYATVIQNNLIEEGDITKDRFASRLYESQEAREAIQKVSDQVIIDQADDLEQCLILMNEKLDGLLYSAESEPAVVDYLDTIRNRLKARSKILAQRIDEWHRRHKNKTKAK